MALPDLVPAPKGAPTPSVAPGQPITWPVVGYKLVKELPFIVMVAAGGVVAVVLLLHNPAASLEPIASVSIPALLAVLGKSRPAGE